jgi:hypothetical protein
VLKSNPESFELKSASEIFKYLKKLNNGIQTENILNLLSQHYNIDKMILREEFDKIFIEGPKIEATPTFDKRTEVTVKDASSNYMIHDIAPSIAEYVDAENGFASEPYSQPYIYEENKEIYDEQYELDLKELLARTSQNKYS